MQLMKIDLITIIMKFIYFVTAKETMEKPKQWNNRSLRVSIFDYSK